MGYGLYSRGVAFLVAAALLHLAGEVMQALEQGVTGSIVLELSFILFAVGFLLLPLALNVQTRPFDVAASVCAFLGSIAGAAMQVLFRSRTVLTGAGNAEAVETLNNSPAIHSSTLVPGILFPLGIAALVVALWLSRRLTLSTAAVLGLGSLLFPAGHAANITVARFASDLLITLGCLLLAMVTRQQEHVDDAAYAVPPNPFHEKAT